MVEYKKMKETITTANTECSRPARRSFLKKSGVALSGVLAAAVAGSAKADVPVNNTDDLTRRLGMLEDANAVREVYRTYESALNQERYEDALNLFTANSEVSFGGGIFTGKDKGVQRLYMENFRQGLTGKTIEMPEAADIARENIETSANRQSAKAVFSYSMRVGTPMDASLQLVQMARIHGGGIQHWKEHGLCEVSFVKDGTSWKISRIEYRPAQSDETARFTNTYPENTLGPDRLV
jgi:hypothetical protein